jgi:malonyl-CoA/methylmalonyl-CoA synthetase
MTQDDDITVLMAVPTMYTYLLMAYDKSPPDQQAAFRAAAAKLRLAVSGSAAAPAALLDRWREVSGQTLLERYGMTETGMILSNPYEARGRARAGPRFPPVPASMLPAVQLPARGAAAAAGCRLALHRCGLLARGTPGPPAPRPSRARPAARPC